MPNLIDRFNDKIISCHALPSAIPCEEQNRPRARREDRILATHPPYPKGGPAGATPAGSLSAHLQAARVRRRERRALL